jgi:8-oxo-dGTP diphosphatase
VKQVTAAVIIENDRLFLARRGPDGSLPGYWELPGGKLEDGETIQECLERELDEELGMVALAGGVIATTTYHYDHGSFEMFAVEATRCSDFMLRVHDAVAWTTRDEIHELLLAPADVQLIAGIVATGRW